MPALRVQIPQVEIRPPERFVVAVDGSDASMAGLNLCCHYWMEKVRTCKLTAVHVYDDTKVLAPRNKKEQVSFSASISDYNALQTRSGLLNSGSDGFLIEHGWLSGARIIQTCQTCYCDCRKRLSSGNSIVIALCQRPYFVLFCSAHPRQRRQLRYTCYPDKNRYKSDLHSCFDFTGIRCHSI